MITFEDFTIRLAHGQLKNTAAVDDDNLGIICPEYLPTLLSLTNQGLVELATKFPLFKSQVDLTFVDGQNMYPLTFVNVGVTLNDTVEEPFLDENFIKVLDIFDADGTRHNVNTSGHILTPSFNMLRFTAAKILEITEATEGKVRVRYQSKPTPITETDVINLPPNMEIALQLFVASLYISHMGGEEHSAKGDSYYAAYLRHIGEDEMKDLSSTSEVEENTKFQERGFV